MAFLSNDPAFAFNTIEPIGSLKVSPGIRRGPVYCLSETTVGPTSSTVIQKDDPRRGTWHVNSSMGHPKLEKARQSCRAYEKEITVQLLFH